MKKTFLIIILAVLAIIMLLFFLGQRSGRSRLVRVGDHAPDFRLPSVDGTIDSLSAHRGRALMVHFWATWCPPCVEELPSLDRFARSEQGRNIDILAVSVDEGGAETVRAFLQKHGLSLPVLLDPDHSVAARYGTFKFPETYLVDRNGVVRNKLIGAVDWTGSGARGLVDALIQVR